MTDNRGVTLHDEKGFDDLSLARPEPKGFSYALARSGVVNNPSDAAVILAVVAIFVIAGSIYLFAQSIPEPQTLGNDQLRPGETVPDYLR